MAQHNWVKSDRALQQAMEILDKMIAELSTTQNTAKTDPAENAAS